MPNYKLMYFNMRGRAEIIRYIFAYFDIKYEDHRIEQADWPEIKSTLPFGKIPVLEVDGLLLHQSLAIARYLTRSTDRNGFRETWSFSGFSASGSLGGSSHIFCSTLTPETDAAELESPRTGILGNFLDATDAPARGPHFGSPRENIPGRDLAGKTAMEQCQADALVDTLDDFMSCFPWAEKKQEVKNEMFNKLLMCEAPHLLQRLETYLGDNEWFIGNSVTWADFYWDICSTTLLVLKPDLLDKHPSLQTLRKKVQAIPAIAAWVQRRPQTKL